MVPISLSWPAPHAIGEMGGSGILAHSSTEHGVEEGVSALVVASEVHAAAVPDAATRKKSDTATRPRLSIVIITPERASRRRPYIRALHLH
jgi:hypothetical protein